MIVYKLLLESFSWSLLFFYRACGCTAWNSRGGSNGCHELPCARHLIYINSFYLRLPLSLEIGIVPTPNRLFLWGDRLRCWATKPKPRIWEVAQSGFEGRPVWLPGSGLSTLCCLAWPLGILRCSGSSWHSFSLGSHTAMTSPMSLPGVLDNTSASPLTTLYLQRDGDVCLEDSSS